MIFLCDIDGTVANLEHRLHFIQSSKKDWNSFFKSCVDDEPIPEVISTIKMLYIAGATIIMVSGRSDVVRQETETWLNIHSVPHANLYMRSDGDRREDYLVKSELLDQIRKDYTEPIVGVFDDRKQVVDMFRNRGLKVFQVAEGLF